MIYVVEMDFPHPAREHAWHTWYIGHVAMLIANVPGFRASQRFRALTPTPSPWLALHEVDSAAVFESAAYKANGGPASTGEWGPLHTNWRRNLLAGFATSPRVEADEHLLMAESGAALPAPVAARLTWLDMVGLDMVGLEMGGLDRSSPQRGIAVLASRELAALHFGIAGLGVYKPIMPKITGG